MTARAAFGGVSVDGLAHGIGENLDRWVLSLVIALGGAVTPLGMLVGGVLGDVTGMRLAAMFVGCGAAATATVAIATAQSAFRALLGGDAPAGDEGEGEP
jgi:MFS family permease